MSLASIVQTIFAAYSSFFADALTYRTLTSGTWSSTSTLYAEIVAKSVSHEYDDHSGSRVKRERATAKVYDTTALVAPTLKLGDEIIDASSVHWTITGKDVATVGNGIYRYHLSRDIPLRGEVDRGGFQPEGGATAVTGAALTTFNATNVEGSATIFLGALVHRTTTGVLLARNDVTGKSAIGMCILAAASGSTATIATEGAVTLNDWTAIMGATVLTLDALYFLDATVGKMTTTPPTTGWSQPIGKATSTTTLDLEIVEALRL